MIEDPLRSDIIQMKISDNKMALGNIKTDLILTGENPFTQCSRSSGYQLPTQRHHRKQSKACTIHTLCHGVKAKDNQPTFETTSKLTNKILSLYSTPVEREIPFKRARSIVTKGSIYSESYPFTNDRFPHIKTLENTAMPMERVDAKSSALQPSSNLGDDNLEESGMSHMNSSNLAKNVQDDVHVMEHKIFEPKATLIKANSLEQIRPRHPGLSKEDILKPEKELKINGMVLTKRLNLNLVPFNSYNLPQISNARLTLAPQHWWKYLNEKIEKRLSVSASPKPSSMKTTLLRHNKGCKLCQLNPEDEDLVKQNKQGKDVLHIDLKRLSEVRSKDWSSYGHYTRIHKLRYTKRSKGLPKVKDPQIDIDEDYLCVDIDRLMKLYEQKENDELASNVVSLSCSSDKNKDSNCGLILPDVVARSISRNQDCSSNLQRPTTTKLRSCVNFSRRKTCFPSI